MNTEDFKANAERLTVVVNVKMGNKPLTSFHALAPSQQTKFNRILNEYIRDMGENWSKKLDEDFNRIVNEDILNEDFNPEKFLVKAGESKLLMTEEQKVYYEENNLKV